MACVHFPCTSNLSINHNHFPKRTIYLKKEAEKFQIARIDRYFSFLRPSFRIEDRDRVPRSKETLSLSLPRNLLIRSSCHLLLLPLALLPLPPPLLLHLERPSTSRKSSA